MGGSSGGRVSGLGCHKFGVQVADLIGADAKEIIFTSGATESNNLAIKGVANFYKDKKKHIITTQTDRKALPSPSLSEDGLSKITDVLGIILTRG